MSYPAREDVGDQNTPGGSLVSPLDNPVSEPTLQSELIRQLNGRMDGFSGRMDGFSAVQRDLLEAVRVGNVLSDKQVALLQRKDDRDVAAMDASKDARARQTELEHKERIESAKWKRETFGGPIVKAIVGTLTLIGAAVSGWFLRGFGGDGP